MSLILLGILNSQVSGAAAGAYDLLETQVLTSTASSVTFTGLGSYTDYKHLQIRFTARTAAATSELDSLQFYPNGSSANVAAHHVLRGNGSSVSSSSDTSGIASFVGDIVASDSNASGVFSSGIMDVLDFSSTSKNTTFRLLSGGVGDGAEEQITLISYLYNNLSAITSLTFAQSNNFNTGSRFSLYGVK